MRSLLNFILKFHYFILFILLECFSVLLLVQYNDYHRASFLNSSSSTAGRVYSTFHTVFQYLNLKTVNIELSEALAQQLSNSKASYKNNQVDIVDIFDSVYVQQYKYIPAQVINNSINKQNNYLTLNVGRNQGVHKEMAVISGQGIVGVVKDVSNNFSSVISILNQNLKISAMIKSSGYFGSLYWEGDDYRYAVMSDLPNHIIANVGDTIITSGYSAMFPKGIIVGTISNVSDNKGSDFITVDVKIEVDFKNLGHVMVINNLLRSEQLKLETYTSDD